MNNLIELDGLQTHFHTDSGFVTALRDIHFSIQPNEIVGLVGESGCGKSVTAKSILRLYDENTTVRYNGSIRYRGTDLLSLSQRRMNDIRGKEIAMIFQDALSSLNPLFTVGEQITETIQQHRKLSMRQAREEALRLLKVCGIPAPEERMNVYPHQLSGGMQQRVMIAIALSCQPKLLIADEPTTALDVTIQAQILSLFRELNHSMDMAILFITHDLAVISELCTRVAVMYLGEIVEMTDAKTLFEKPLHPYTCGLIASIPPLDAARKSRLSTIPGSVPSLRNIPKGCAFADRCPWVDEQCRNEHPPLRETEPNHPVRCWHADPQKGCPTW